jgi:hypothetical protein
LYYSTYVHGNITRKLLVELSKANKNVILVFTKMENKRAEQVLSGELVPVGRVRRWGMGVGG